MLVNVINNYNDPKKIYTKVYYVWEDEEYLNVIITFLQCQ
jgi:hypothetical protein